MNPMRDSLVCAFAALTAWTLVAAAGDAGLSEKAAAAVKASFPDARITGVGRERERGAWYFEVALTEGKRKVEMEVTEDGVIGEIESRVAFGDLPDALQRKVRERVGRGRVARIERHERRGVARSGEFVALKTPRISYEVKYYDETGQRRELQLASDAVQEVPEAILAMIGRTFPAARVGEAEMEDDDGVLLYVLSLVQDGGRFTVVASRDGELVERETVLALEDLPDAARKCLDERKEWRAVEKVRVGGWETYLAVEEGKLVNRRDQHLVVTLERKGKAKEFRFDGRGKLLSEGKWQDVGDGDDGDEDDD